MLDIHDERLQTKVQMRRFRANKITVLIDLLSISGYAHLLNVHEKLKAMSGQGTVREVAFESFLPEMSASPSLEELTARPYFHQRFGGSTWPLFALRMAIFCFIKECRSLRALTLDPIFITDMIVEVLKNLPRLESLSLLGMDYMGDGQRLMLRGWGSGPFPSVTTFQCKGFAGRDIHDHLSWFIGPEPNAARTGLSFVMTIHDDVEHEVVDLDLGLSHLPPHLVNLAIHYKMARICIDHQGEYLGMEVEKLGRFSGLEKLILRTSTPLVIPLPTIEVVCARWHCMRELDISSLLNENESMRLWIDAKVLLEYEMEGEMENDDDDLPTASVQEYAAWKRGWLELDVFQTLGTLPTLEKLTLTFAACSTASLIAAAGPSFISLRELNCVTPLINYTMAGYDDRIAAKFLAHHVGHSRVSFVGIEPSGIWLGEFHKHSHDEVVEFWKGYQTYLKVFEVKFREAVKELHETHSVF